MSNLSKKSATTNTPFTNQNIILLLIAWAAISLLFFLLFSAKIPAANGTEERAKWYIIGTYILENVAYLSASILCFRNWRSPQIVSSKLVWLLIGLGMFFYFLGNILMGYWEIYLNYEPIVSFGDVFFVATYLCLCLGMVLAIKSRRLNLEQWQWLVVLAIAITGGSLAWLLSQTPAGAVKENLPVQWEQIASIVNLFYVVLDVFLLIIATILLLAFWGGRVSQSWQMIAGAAFCLYIGDMWLKYADNHIQDYQTGEIIEVFWVFSGVLFGIGAALEYGTSIRRSHRVGGRKRG